MSKRFSKQNWIDLGLHALKTDGPDALTIERLCEEAGKTRGSFYFHFETTDAFLIALAENWHETFTAEIISLATPQTDRLDLLNQLASRVDLQLEAAMRQLAVRNVSVQEIVSRADKERLDWLAKLYEQTGKYDQAIAEKLAHIEYAAFIGFKLIDPEMKPADAKEFYDSFLELTARA